MLGIAIALLVTIGAVALVVFGLSRLNRSNNGRDGGEDETVE